MSSNSSGFEDFEREDDPLRRESRPVRPSYEREHVETVEATDDEMNASFDSPHGSNAANNTLITGKPGCSGFVEFEPDEDE